MGDGGDTVGGAAGGVGGRVARRLAGRGLFYGWVMLGVATVATVMTSPGQSFLIGSFNDAIRAELGLSLSALSGAYLVATFCASLPLTFVGKASDRFGTRAVMGAVVVAFGGACVAAGFARGVVTLTLVFFFLRFLGQGALGMVSSHVLAMWFERKLGFAEGVRHLGMPLANAVLPAPVLGLIAWIGWGPAYAVLGLAVWGAVLPLVVFLYVNRPEDVGQHLDGGLADEPHPDRRLDDPEEPVDLEMDSAGGGPVGSGGVGLGVSPEAAEVGPGGGGAGERAFTLRQAMATRAYWTVVGCLVLNALAGTSFVFHRQPMVEDWGYGVGVSSAVMVTFGLVSFALTLPAGWLTDRLPLHALLAGATVGLGASSAAYAFVPWTPAPLLVLHGSYAVLGASQALIFVIVSPIFARFYGRPHHGAIRGSLTTFMVVGTSAGPFVMSFGRDVGGTFYGPFFWVGVVALPLSVLALMMRVPAWPVVGGRGATGGGSGG